VDRPGDERGTHGEQPRLQDSYGILGWSAVDISATSLDDFRTPYLSLTPRPGALRVEVHLPT